MPTLFHQDITFFIRFCHILHFSFVSIRFHSFSIVFIHFHQFSFVFASVFHHSFISQLFQSLFPQQFDLDITFRKLNSPVYTTMCTFLPMYLAMCSYLSVFVRICQFRSFSPVYPTIRFAPLGLLRLLRLVFFLATCNFRIYAKNIYTVKRNQP